MRYVGAAGMIAILLGVAGQTARADEAIPGDPPPGWLPPKTRPECLQIAIARHHSFRAQADDWLSKPQTATVAEMVRERVAHELRARTSELFPAERTDEDRHRAIAAIAKAAMSAANSMSVLNKELRVHSYYRDTPDTGSFGTFLLGEISHGDLLAAMQRAYVLPAVRDTVGKRRLDDVARRVVDGLDIAVWSSPYFDWSSYRDHIDWNPPPAMPAVTGFTSLSNAGAPLASDLRSADWLPISERGAISLYRVGSRGIAREATLDVGGACVERLSFATQADGLAIACECWSRPKKSCDWSALHLFHRTGDRLVRDFSVSLAELPELTKVRRVALDDRRFILAGDFFAYHLRGHPNPIHVFTYDTSHWALEQTITPTVRDVEFGTSFAIEGETIAVGAPGFPSGAPRDPSNNRGRVNVYDLHDHRWLVGRKLMADDSHVGDRFGSAVALEGDILAVGADMDDTTAAEAGSVYIFQRNGSSWTLCAKLTPPDFHRVRHFGRTLALDEGVLFVGAETVDYPGTIYEFHHSGGFWRCFRRFGPDGTDVQFIGKPLIVYDDWVVTTGRNRTGGASEVLLFPRR